MTADPGRDHGRLVLDGGVLSYARGGATVWSVPLARVRVVGESTTQEGPWADDWFVVFVAADPFQVFTAPVEAEGVVLGELSERLGAALEHGLANCTDVSSRVLWPADLRGRPLFDVRPAPRGPGAWSRVKDALVPLVDLVPTEEVRTLTGR